MASWLLDAYNFEGLRTINLSLVVLIWMIQHYLHPVCHKNVEINHTLLAFCACSHGDALRTSFWTHCSNEATGAMTALTWHSEEFGLSALFG